MRIDPGNAAAGVHRSVRSESWGGRSDRGSEDGESCIGWGIHRRVGAEAGAWSSVPAAHAFRKGFYHLAPPFGAAIAGGRIQKTP